MIDYHTLRNWSFAPIEHCYTVEDTQRYALALGYGMNPLDPHELQFVSEHRAGGVVALPSMAVVLGWPGSWMQNPATGIDFSKIVHGEENLVVHQPLPTQGTVIAQHNLRSVVDKGLGRGAIITYDKQLFDKRTGTLLATVTHVTFARADGGFSACDGLSDAPAAAPAPMPTRTPDSTVLLTTTPQQALLYRLCADRNPLHSEPEVARQAGFDRPILHGLCTYGMVARALVSSCCNHDPARLRQLFTRFSAPVFPGETLRISLFAEAGNTVRFRAHAGERLVLDFGHATIAGIE
jgi:acyl dehydratase